MMARRFTVDVSDEIERWTSGLGRLADVSGGKAEWRAANDVFFSKTQQYVHVISGDLRTSGVLDVNDVGPTIVATITYGGVEGTQGPVDYAAEEIARGGDHDFIGKAFGETTNILKAAVGAAMAATLTAHLGG